MAAAKKRGLGRGLDALLGEVALVDRGVDAEVIDVGRVVQGDPDGLRKGGLIPGHGGDEGRHPFYDLRILLHRTGGHGAVHRGPRPS